MRFEDLDKKFKEAADHHHPAYDEKAWTKMEKLLDKHLPQEKERKRRIFLWLFLFLVIGGAGLLIGKPFRQDKQAAQSEKNIQEKKNNDAVQSATGNTGVSVIKKNSPINEKSFENKPDAADNSDNSTAKNVVIAEQTDFEKQTIAISSSAGQKKKMTGKKQAKDDQPFAPINQASDNPSTPLVNTPSGDSVSSKPNEVTDNNATIKIADNKKEISLMPDVTANSDKVIIKKDSAVTQTDIAAQQNTKEKKSKTKNSKSSAFFFTATAGPDISFTRNDRPGKISPVLGLGMGYTFKDRFTIRTGFYTASKIYTASPEAYHPPDIFYTFYPYLEKVEADCKVYEIPLTISYNFGITGKQNWFVSAGLSSYLMKRETYNYFYKNFPSGPTYNSEWTIENENKHLFSVFTLSGGYQRQLSRSVSIIAEPYVKLPSGGVGYGKVKLNSAGLLFSVGIKPFVIPKKQIKPAP
ncbi:MAG: hypothetical protein JNK27_15065 [Chitinophagaceae bacterium]|nr:hypothetical protein [Chitinophagaceae bacterium]